MALAGTTWGLIRLVRPGNAALAALGVLAGMLLSVGPLENLPCDDPHGIACPPDARPGPGPHFPAVLAAPLAAFLITGFGNVLNDVRDVAVDRRAHPGRPLPQGVVGIRAAWRLGVALASMGLSAALLAGVAPFLFACAVVALLLLYEARLKATGLAGNAAVALLAASTFLFGAVAQGWEAPRFAIVAAAMAFLVNLAREVAKDIQDMVADLGHRTTAPMTWGARKAGMVALAAAALGVVASMPFLAWTRPCLERQDWIVLAALLAGANLAVLAGGSLAATRPRFAQGLLKLGMALALVAFLVAAPNLPNLCL